MDMKKLLSILAITGVMTACGDNSNNSSEKRLDSTNINGQVDPLNMGRTDSTGPGLGIGAEGSNSGTTGSGSTSSETNSQASGTDKGLRETAGSSAGSPKEVGDTQRNSGNRKDSL